MCLCVFVCVRDDAAVLDLLSSFIHSDLMSFFSMRLVVFTLVFLIALSPFLLFFFLLLFVHGIFNGWLIRLVSWLNEWTSKRMVASWLDGMCTQCAMFLSLLFRYFDFNSRYKVMRCAWLDLSWLGLAWPGPNSIDTITSQWIFDKRSIYSCDDACRSKWALAFYWQKNL